MTRVAAIDCGTNSIRMLVAEVSDGALVDLARRMEIVRLGEGVDRTGRLAPQAIERTRLALADYAAQAERFGVDRVRMVATSATRDASNRDDFRRIVLATLGAEPEVITGAEEASLSFTGAVRGLAGSSGDAVPPYLVADIGGGSTELVLGTSSVHASHSMDVGCVRLTERHLTDDPPTPAQVAAAKADVEAALQVARADVALSMARTFIGLAGSVTTVAAIALGLPEYDPARIHHSRISADQVREVSRRLVGMTHAQRAALPVMHPGRVDVIGAGALVLRVLVDAAGVDRVVVSEHDILDGIAWSIA
jgi:exopolyphosphatase/guanosine-5'-triphosphate,3'-diphosphate pyrophosphatase